MEGCLPSKFGFGLPANHVATFFGFLWDVVCVQSRSLGAGSDAVLEDEAIFETASFDQLDCLLKFFLCFPAESHDEVTCNGCVGKDLVDAIHHFHVIGNGVSPLHSL